MIDYKAQAKHIFDTVVFSRVMDTDTTLLKIEERIRKIGHVEYLRGEHDRMNAEKNRHDALAIEIANVRGKACK